METRHKLITTVVMALSMLMSVWLMPYTNILSLNNNTVTLNGSLNVLGGIAGASACEGYYINEVNNMTYLYANYSNISNQVIECEG